MPYQIKNGIIYGSNAVSLTQAQYDALSTAEKNNGTVYYIYDVDDIYSGNVVKNVVLSASKWASDAYIITDPDITGANIVFLTYPPSTSDEVYSAIQSANIRVTNQANGSITLQALGGAPSINLTVTLIIQGIDMGLQTAEYITYDNSTSGLEAVNVQEAIDELSNCLTVQFASTGWTTTETVNNTTYYTQTVSVASVSGKPIIGITPITGTLPTSEEQDSFDSVEYFTANDTANTIKGYATSAPANTFAVVVK